MSRALEGIVCSVLAVPILDPEDERSLAAIFAATLRLREAAGPGGGPDAANEMASKLASLVVVSGPGHTYKRLLRAPDLLT